MRNVKEKVLSFLLAFSFYDFFLCCVVVTKRSCFGKSELLCNNNHISLYIGMFS